MLFPSINEKMAQRLRSFRSRDQISSRKCISSVEEKEGFKENISECVQIGSQLGCIPIRSESNCGILESFFPTFLTRDYFFVLITFYYPSRQNSLIILVESHVNLLKNAQIFTPNNTILFFLFLPFYSKYFRVKCFRAA